MKTFSQLPRGSFSDKTPAVISILSSEIPSLEEELIIRTGYKISKELGLNHLVLLQKSPISESDIIRNYITRFSDSIHYIDSTAEFKEITEQYNSRIICNESTSNLFYNPVVIDSKNLPITESVIEGNFESFKKYSFNDLREIDCKCLFNLIRESYNLKEIKEKIELPKDSIREIYFRKEIFNIGDTVEYKGELCEILDRGSNYLVIVNNSGNVRKSWVTDLHESSEHIHWKPLSSDMEISFKGFETKNFHKISEETKVEFINLVEQSNDHLLILKTIQLMDQFIGGDIKSKERLGENIKKIQEDIMSSDFKLGKDGRKVRARRIVFKNKVNGKDDSSEQDDDDDEEEEKPVKEEFDTKLEYHDTLNRKLWDEQDMLIPEVREKLVRIADAFEEFIDKDGKIFEVVDIIITGSNCNYNYTPQSDIDLHLVLNLDKVEDKELVGAFLTAKKTLWKDQHDIKIKGYHVELYAQDRDNHLVATGIYSIINNKWIEKPQRIKLNIDNFSVQTKAGDIINQIDHIIAGHATVDQIDAVKAKIKKMRQSGLSKGGEFSVENLAFKAIRNNGYFDKLNDLKKSITDKDLSLESVVMNKNRTNNGAVDILSAKDFHNLVNKLKTSKSLK